MIVTASMVAAVAVLIYLADCIVLVDRGQGILQVGWPGVSATFGSRYYVFRERPVVLLNPLTPWRLPVKSIAILAGQHAQPVAVRSIRALRFIGALCTLQAMFVLVLCPFALHYGPGVPFLSAVALAFVIAISGALALWPHRASLRMTTSTYANLVIGAIVCLPLSINVARKAALAGTTRLSAQQLLRFVPQTARDEVRGQLITQLDELRLSVEDSRSHAAIDRMLTSLSEDAGDVGP